MRGESAYKPDGLKLGDVFHSNPIHIGHPSPYYDAPGFAGFRSSSTVANRPAVVVVGANDGQLHAFRSSDAYELWSIFPDQIMLPELNAIRTTTTHHYILDGQTSVVDANLGPRPHRIGRAFCSLEKGEAARRSDGAHPLPVIQGSAQPNATTNP